MKGVLEITLCKDVSLSYRPIIGMLLWYADGHRACVGQYRFDMALESIRFKEGMILYLGSQRTAKRYLYVADVKVYPPFDPGKLAWIDVDWNGSLEWWFSDHHCIVYSVESVG